MKHVLTTRALLALGTLCALYLHHTRPFAPAHALGVTHFRWNTCLHAPSHVIAIRRYNADIGTCTRLCWQHPNCTALQYMTVRRCCEVLSADANEFMRAVAVPCVVIRREDIHYEGQVSNDSNVCDETPDTCEACEELIEPKGDVYGNMRHVGARMKLECELGSVVGNHTSYPVCQDKHTWSDVLDCDICRLVHAVPTSWANSIRVRVTPDHVFTYEAAHACCGEVGGKLVRIDTDGKYWDVKNFLVDRGYDFDCFYIQGTYYNDYFRFEDGDAIPLTSWYWNVDPGKSKCVTLDSEYKLNDVNCNQLCGVICQP